MNINKTLKWLIYFGLFAVPFIPLIVTEASFFPFITGKNFCFRLIIEIVLALWLILAIRDKNFWPKRSCLIYTVLTLMFVVGLATIFSLNPYRSFWSNFERMGGYLGLLHVGAYFLVLISMLRHRREWFWLANISLLANLYVVLYGFAQLLGREDIHQSASRLDASLGNSAYLAVYALFHIFIAVYLAIEQWSKNKLLASLYLVSAFFNVIILYYTATRGTLLGLIGGIFVTLILVAIFRPGLSRRISLSIIGLMLLSVMGFILVKETTFIQQSPVLSRLASISLDDGTTKSRFMIWQMSLFGFKEHPVLGWGPENYSLVFSKYFNPAMWGQEPWFDRSHNIFLDWLIDAGLLGLLSYLSIFVTALWYLWQRRQRFGFGVYLLAGLLTAYLFQNIFVFDNLISYIYFFAVIAFIHVVVTTDEIETDELVVKKNYQKSKSNQLSESQELIQYLLIAVIGVSALSSIYYFNYRPYLVSVDLIRAINPGVSSPAESLEIFRQIFKRQTFGSGEAFEQFLSLTLRQLNDPQVSEEIKNGYLRLADEQLDVQYKIFNQDARLDLLAGSYLTTIGRLDDGLALLQEAQRLSPKKQQVLFELGVSYIRRQDASKAMAVIKQAYDLDPAYPEARKMYALLLLLTNQRDLALEVLAPIKNDPTYYNDERFLSVYREANDKTLEQEIMTLRNANKK